MFTLFSFQLSDLDIPNSVMYYYYLTVSGLGSLHTCCFPWMWVFKVKGVTNDIMGVITSMHSITPMIIYICIISVPSILIVTLIIGSQNHKQYIISIGSVKTDLRNILLRNIFLSNSYLFLLVRNNICFYRLNFDLFYRF